VGCQGRAASISTSAAAAAGAADRGRFAVPASEAGGPPWRGVHRHRRCSTAALKKGMADVTAMSSRVAVAVARAMDADALPVRMPVQILTAEGRALLDAIVSSARDQSAGQSGAPRWNGLDPRWRLGRVNKPRGMTVGELLAQLRWNRRMVDELGEDVLGSKGDDHGGDMYSDLRAIDEFIIAPTRAVVLQASSVKIMRVVDELGEDVLGSKGDGHGGDTYSDLRANDEFIIAPTRAVVFHASSVKIKRVRVASTPGDNKFLFARPQTCHPLPTLKAEIRDPEHPIYPIHPERPRHPKL